ncbi:MAG: hypothetical protein V1770_00070 [bacterium]
MKLKFFILFILIFPLLAFSQSPNTVDVFFFYQHGCPHCEEMKLFLAELVRNNDSIKVNAYEISSDINNQALFIEMTKAYKIRADGVPVIFIGDKAVNGNYATEVENTINNCLSLGCSSPLDILKNYDKTKKSDNALHSDLTKLRWFLLVFAIIFILSLIYFSKKRKTYQP